MVGYEYIFYVTVYTAVMTAGVETFSAVRRHIFVVLTLV